MRHLRLVPRAAATVAVVVAAVAARATPAAAQAQPPVRAARPAATTTPLRDDDLAWIAPLMAVQGTDLQRGNAHVGAATDALAAHASADAGAARVARLRAGTLRALDELRGYSAHAVAPPGARYDAACSAELTARTGGLATTAFLAVADVAAARAFYRQRGWEVLGDARSGYVLRAPDGKLRGSLAAPDLAAVHARCADARDGHGLTLQHAGQLESEARAQAAYAAAQAASPERLPAALRQAGLTPAQWDAVWEVLTQAQSDELLLAQPGALERAAGSAAEAARRQANVAWYRRHRAAVDAATRAAMGGG